MRGQNSKYHVLEFSQWGVAGDERQVPTQTRMRTPEMIAPRSHHGRPQQQVVELT